MQVCTSTSVLHFTLSRFNTDCHQHSSDVCYVDNIDYLHRRRFADFTDFAVAASLLICKNS